MRNFIPCLLAFAALFTITLSGCGGKTMEEAGTKASGTIMLDGEPLTVGTINFYPTGEGNSAFATINSDGTFTVNTSAGTTGLDPGTYKVAIAYSVDPIVNADGTETPGINPIPEKYRNEENPIIEVTVPEGGDDNLMITLESK